jgi:hypothetical protein
MKAVKDFGYLLRLTLSLLKAFQKKKISIQLVRRESEPSIEGEETLSNSAEDLKPQQSFIISMANGTSVEIDEDGNISLFSPSSISIKSRLIFLVSNEDPHHMDKFISDAVKADKEKSFQIYADMNELNLYEESVKN